MEHKKHEIADQICEEKSKIKKPMTKDFIVKYFDKALKLSANKLIDILIDEILVYDGEIKIKFNYSNENSQVTREFMNYTTTYKATNHSRKPQMID